jgi:hypothetical protein
MFGATVPSMICPFRRRLGQKPTYVSRDLKGNFVLQIGDGGQNRRSPKADNHGDSQSSRSFQS